MDDSAIMCDVIIDSYYKTKKTTFIIAEYEFLMLYNANRRIFFRAEFLFFRPCKLPSEI